MHKCQIRLVSFIASPHNAGIGFGAEEGSVTIDSRGIWLWKVKPAKGHLWYVN